MDNAICKKCHLHYNQTISKDCPLCKELAFPENVLCQLTNRGRATNKVFECNAFKPLLLTLVDDQKKKSKLDKKIEDKNDEELSNKIKWLRAYAQQQLGMNPDQIYHKLTYHICLITKGRKPLFSAKDIDIEKISNIFRNIGPLLKKTYIHLLHLSMDHVHLFVDSTPNYSIDEIVNKAIEKSEDEMLKIYPELFTNNGDNIWEKYYFSETVG